MRQLIEERGIKDIAGMQALVKELTAGLIKELEEEEQRSVTKNPRIAKRPGIMSGA